MVLLLEVKKLGEKIDAASARRDAGEPQAPYWLGLSKEEQRPGSPSSGPVSSALPSSSTPRTSAKLPPCWAGHAELVLEIDNMMTEWARIYGHPDNRALARMPSGSHERWLPGVLSRLREVVQVRCERLLAGEDLAVGAIAAALTPDRPEGPGVLLLRRDLLRVRLADLHLGLGVLFSRRARNGPARRLAATRPPGTAQPGARARRARQCPPGPSQRAARRPGPAAGPPWR